MYLVYSSELQNSLLTILSTVLIYRISCSQNLSTVLIYRIPCSQNLSTVQIYRIPCSQNLSTVLNYRIPCSQNLSTVLNYRISCTQYLSTVLNYRIPCSQNLSVDIIYVSKKAGGWRVNPSGIRAKGDRFVRTRALPVGDNAMPLTKFQFNIAYGLEEMLLKNF